MTTTRTAIEILDRDFLDVRHRLLDIAAALDRIDRGGAPEEANDDSRMAQVRSALGILMEPRPGRAERVQMAFSRAYDPKWQA